MTTPDQGLRYELAAVIGAADALAGVAAVLGVEAVPLDAADLVLVPVTAAGEVTPAALCTPGMDVIPGGTPYAAQRREGWSTGRESGFAVLTPGLVAVVEAASTRGPLACSTASVSVALRELGVVSAGRRDDFVVAGLGRHRRKAGWLLPRPPSPLSHVTDLPDGAEHDEETQMTATDDPAARPGVGA